MNKTINAKTAKIIRKIAKEQTKGKTKEYTRRYYRVLKKEYQANYHDK